MTNVAAANSSAGSVQFGTSSAVKTNMDYNSFLKLFMAQMKNQDPTKPNDPTATLSQLASFSNVEQSIKLNDKLETLISASNATLASALLGKTVSSLDGSVTGIAATIESGSSGLTAKLTNGQELKLAGGYKVGPA